jgi:acyl-coenzyme A synthetase/AMP-(fatty) acid ligase
LLSDPAVAEAAAFAVPDPIYGEEIQAAVVLQADVTTAALQAYCRSRLSDFEVPKVIHIVKELPKDSTGKVERHRLTDVFSK